MSDDMIPVGSHRLQIRRQGAGAPAVLLDTGITDEMEKLQPLQARIARFTEAIAYNRAGYGRSEAGPLPRDGGREAEELRSLVRAAAVPPPYVLAGHSLGALNVQVFASRYPEDVAGVVLMDPPPLPFLLGETYPEMAAMADLYAHGWRSFGEAVEGSDDPRDRARSAFCRMVVSEHEEAFRATARQLASITSLGEGPLVVLASGSPNPAFGEAGEEFQTYWVKECRALAARFPGGEFSLLARASHHLYLDEPDLVAEKIRSLVEGARAG